MDGREDGHLVHCGDDKEQNREDPLDMSRSEVSGNTRDLAIQTVPKVLLSEFFKTQKQLHVFWLSYFVSVFLEEIPTISSEKKSEF